MNIKERLTITTESIGTLSNWLRELSNLINMVHGVNGGRYRTAGIRLYYVLFNSVNEIHEFTEKA